MAYYNNYPTGYPAYTPAPGYGGAMPDNLAQLRQNPQPWGQPMPSQMPQNPMQGGTMPAPMQAEQQMIWVQGEAGAKAFMVVPGATAVLWDSEQSVIYLKSADQNGVPSMEYLYYTRQKPQPPVMMPDAGAQGVSRAEFDRLTERVEGLCRDIYGAQQTKEVGNAERALQTDAGA